ncbi:MAG: putative quinol monooxygenase [Chitinophagales bacterium]
MITRIVKMHFRADEIESFLATFEKQKEFIAGFEGCSHLELLQDKNDNCHFFTYSHWKDESYLELYRKSDFFRGIWSVVKLKFDKKPEAWSLISPQYSVAVGSL